MSLFDKARERLLTIFGDIKVYPWPMFVLYDPGSYEVKGEDIREATELVRPGDILLRGYLRYLDGLFIPGYFSHAGLYLGEVVPGDIDFVKRHDGKSKFRTGKQMVIHAMADGVFMEDLMTFCRSDYMAVLRFPGTVTRAPDAKPPRIDISKFVPTEKQIFHMLEAEGSIDFEKALPTIREVALSKLGTPFDFELDFESFDRFSCTEFVYFAIKSLHPFTQIEPKVEQVLFLRRAGIKPDLFLDSELQGVWASASTRQSVRTKLGLPAA